MSTEPPLKAGASKHRTFFERLSGVFHTPTREDFIDTLHEANEQKLIDCLLYTSPSPRDA